jgi:hypothetical protein
METTDRSAEVIEGDETADPDVPEINAYATSETRTVFTESDNGDGWIATDLLVEPRR